MGSILFFFEGGGIGKDLRIPVKSLELFEKEVEEKDDLPHYFEEEEPRGEGRNGSQNHFQSFLEKNKVTLRVGCPRPNKKSPPLR